MTPRRDAACSSWDNEEDRANRPRFCSARDEVINDGLAWAAWGSGRCGTNVA